MRREKMAISTYHPSPIGRDPEGLYRAKMAGVSYDDAAIAFGCNPDTMRKHYLALEEIEISDRVMDKLPAGNSGEVREMQNPSAEPTTKDSQPVVASFLSNGTSDRAGNGL